MEAAANREKVYRALQEALRQDKSRTNILKISELGLVEMTRKRTRENLVQMLCEPCGYCEGRGYVLSAESVAFKVLRHVPDSGGDGLFDRFLQEYEMIAAIDHPNVVDIFDLGVADDHAYIAMEYLSEGSLATRLNAPLDPFVAVDYTRQIASALSVIHAAGILHRDLKPTNIMFRDRSSIALIDFGLAKQMELELALTGNGQIFGTPYYMSPEQGHGQALDARSDIYSLGCLFYEMLVGQRPFVAGSAMGIIYQHAHAERPMLNENLCAYSRVLGKMFAAEPNARYASAEQLLGDLDTLRV